MYKLTSQELLSINGGAGFVTNVSYALTKIVISFINGISKLFK